MTIMKSGKTIFCDDEKGGFVWSIVFLTLKKKWEGAGYNTLYHFGSKFNDINWRKDESNDSLWKHLKLCLTIVIKQDGESYRNAQ